MADSARPVLVRDKWSGDVVAELPRSSDADVAAAIDKARTAVAAAWPARARGVALARAADLLGSRRERVTDTMRRETGFSRHDVQGEFERALVTLSLCAQEATRLGGEVVPLGASAGFDQRIAFTMRVPIGVVAAVTPFNAPLNTVCHKIGPALAGGNAVVLKPAELTPLTAQLLVDILHEAGVPDGYLHVCHGSGSEVGARLVRDDRVAFVTFTGSTEVGLAIRRNSGIRPVQMELGSASTTIICADADLPRAARDVERAGFRKAGQVCTSVQNLLVHRTVAAEFTDLLSERVRSLKFGDPADSGTVVGPLITESAAVRAAESIDRAVTAGARVCRGGKREGALVSPTLLDRVRPDMPIAREEIFAPVVNIIEFDTLDQAFAISNASRYGLQVGFYTAAIESALQAAMALNAGGVIINGSSSTRADGMPYGGVKDSGFGREGPAYAIGEMTVPRLVMLGP